MQYIVHKPYFNFEKEEEWLNEMSSKGMALANYSWCRYVFEDTPKNEFIYRIELLESLPSNVKSKAYIKFLEENGVEFVSSYMRWIYLRKKSVEGEFDIYSDINSKIKHYKRILALWYPLMLFEFVIGFNNIFLGTSHFWNVKDYGELSYVNIILGSLCVALGIFILGISIPITKKIKKLKKEKEIRE